jgi:Ribosomal protein L7/L12 C-terminal domain
MARMPYGNRDIVRRLDAIDRKLNLIMDHLGLPKPAYPEVVQHLERRRKIAAIKVYRDATGTGLAEAKRAVEEMERELGLR